jgi:hypothetical protein
VASQWGDGDKRKSGKVESGKVSERVQRGTVSAAHRGRERERQWEASLGSQP